MDKETKEILDEELESAMASHDQDRLRRVMARFIKAIGDCQYKSSDRIKSVKSTVENVEAEISNIKTDIKPMKISHEQYQAEREQRKGARLALRIVWWLVSVIASISAFIIGRFA